MHGLIKHGTDRWDVGIVIEIVCNRNENASDIIIPELLRPGPEIAITQEVRPVTRHIVNSQFNASGIKKRLRACNQAGMGILAMHPDVERNICQLRKRIDEAYVGARVVMHKFDKPGPGYAGL